MLLAYYGDDFTGSTDALEALSRSGVETVLFVDPPTQQQLNRYPNARAIGVAGQSRTMTPPEMDDALPLIYRALQELQPKFVHYKVCSTFDSSPQTGSIGHAIDLGHSIFQNRCVPLVVGAPRLQRFCLFGNLFARSGLDSDVYRLDRHPTMRQHPVTPMTEADLRRHLASQTTRPVELIDVLALECGYDALSTKLANTLRGEVSVLLFDTLAEGHLRTIGGLLWELQAQEEKPQFVVGSSGIEDALAHHEMEARISQPLNQDIHLPRLKGSINSVDRTMVVSGSCSPVTERQIAWAVAHGFAEVALDTPSLLNSNQLENSASEIAERVKREHDAGRSVIVHTSRGPADSRIAATAQVTGHDPTLAKQLGTMLGRVLLESLRRCRLCRVAIAGGDTSGYVARALGIEALEIAGVLEPGAPLCVARSTDASVEGLQISFKGGQVGHDDFFGSLLRGGR